MHGAEIGDLGCWGVLRLLEIREYRRKLEHRVFAFRAKLGSYRFHEGCFAGPRVDPNPAAKRKNSDPSHVFHGGDARSGIASAKRFVKTLANTCFQELTNVRGSRMQFGGELRNGVEREFIGRLRHPLFRTRGGFFLLLRRVSEL